MAIGETKPIHLLLVEDEDSVAGFITKLLSQPFEKPFKVIRFKELGSAIQCLGRRSFDVVLLDLTLPDSKGLSTFLTLQDKAIDTPIIVYTGSEDESMAVRAVQEGAQDYLMKGQFDANGLTRSIHYSIERKRIMNELRERTRELEADEQRLNAIIESNADGIVIVGNAGVVRFVNPEGERLFGRKTEELLEQPFGFPLTPEKATEINILRKTGSPVFVEMRAVKIFWRGESAFLVSLRDMTERNQLEEKKTHLLRELENKNRELNDFAHIVSHDLKNPLAALAMLVQWLAEEYKDRLDDSANQRLASMRRKVDHMHNLISTILRYSKIGRVKEKMERVDLNELVGEVIEMMPNDENISIEIKERLPVIRCEKMRLLQVFQNLISNAVKYMDKPQGKILIRCVEKEGFEEFCIEDNGPGIPERHYQKIFQIFQSLSPRNEFESSGIGLSIVKKIVESYGGKIWVESKEGKGSRFFFKLNKQMIQYHFEESKNGNRAS